MALFTRANISWSVKQIVKMMIALKFIFDNIVQRGYVWENERQSELIASILEGFPIPPIYARRIDGKTYDVLDGKQRLRALYEFVNDMFFLVGISPVNVEVITQDGEAKIEEYDLNGKYFKDLSKELQDIILDYNLSIIYFDGISDADIQKMFRKLNNGKALSTKARNIANCGDLVTVSDIAKHPFFDSILTERGKADRKGIPMVVKMVEMLTKPVDEVSFKSADFNDVMASVDISDDIKVTINSILDMGLRVFNLFEEKDKMAKKKFSAENNFISLVPFFKEALEEGISDEMFRDFIRANFSGRTAVSDVYASAARSGSAATTAIVARHNELTKAWDKFFAVDGENREEAPAPQKEAVDTLQNPQEYRYGMRLRGFAPMCQPMQGLLRREDDMDGEYYDILVYSRELTTDEIADYELDAIV